MKQFGVIIIIVLCVFASELYANDDIFNFDFGRLTQIKSKRNVEVSLGGVLYFVKQPPFGGNIDSALNYDRVSGAVFLSEYLYTEGLSFILDVTIPAQKIRKFDENYNVVQQRMNPSAGIGMGFSPWRIRFPFSTIGRFQIGGIYSKSIPISSSEESYSYPMVFGRFHIFVTTDFTLYVGGAYAFGRSVPAIMYGVGSRF